MLAESGIAVDVAFLTRGEQGVEAGVVAFGRDEPSDWRRCVRARRRRRATCWACGTSYFLNGSDTRLNEEPQLAESIAELLRKESYQRVFCPWPHDAHDDHQATF